MQRLHEPDDKNQGRSLQRIGGRTQIQLTLQNCSEQIKGLQQSKEFELENDHVRKVAVKTKEKLDQRRDQKELIRSSSDN